MGRRSLSTHSHWGDRCVAGQKILEPTLAFSSDPKKQFLQASQLTEFNFLDYHRVSSLGTTDVWDQVVLCCEAVLCIAGSLAASLVSTNR